MNAEKFVQIAKEKFPEVVTVFDELTDKEIVKLVGDSQERAIKEFLLSLSADEIDALKSFKEDDVEVFSLKEAKEALAKRIEERISSSGTNEAPEEIKKEGIEVPKEEEPSVDEAAALVKRAEPLLDSKKVPKTCPRVIHRGPREGEKCGKEITWYGMCKNHRSAWRKANPFLKAPGRY